MHPLRRQRLLTVIFIIVASSVVIGLLLYAARDSINLFYPPSKIIAGEAPLERTIKAGGCVVPGTIERSGTSLEIRFDITDGVATVPVTYEGILPPLFEEGEAAVVDGKLDQSGLFHATRVLAKHDETYTPTEVQDSLEEAAQQEGVDHAKTCEVLEYDS